MLDQVDELVRTVLVRGLSLASTEQVRFQPPDDDLRTAVANLGLNVLSVYLVELRENRSLRSPDWQFTNGPAGPQRELRPARVDCHYLISAWSPATLTPAIEPSLDEHALLYGAMAVLFKLGVLNPSRIYPPGSAALADVDVLIREEDLPVQVVPAEGWPRLGEFWSSMGATQRWRPCLVLTVTVPVALNHKVAGPLVTTRIIEFRQAGTPETAERWLEIGGTVTDGAGRVVTGASVRLAGSGGAPVGTAVTDAEGRFAIGRLAADGYRIAATRPGTGRGEQLVTVPGASGNYDITVT